MIIIWIILAIAATLAAGAVLVRIVMWTLVWAVIIIVRILMWLTDVYRRKRYGY